MVYIEWMSDISQAPVGITVETKRTNNRGVVKTFERFQPTRCVVATKCGMVMVSWILESGRWMGLAEKEEPIAWTHCLQHPDEIGK